MSYGRGIRVVCLLGNIGTKTQEAPTEEINLLKVLLLCPVALCGFHQRHPVNTYSSRSV